MTPISVDSAVHLCTWSESDDWWMTLRWPPLTDVRIPQVHLQFSALVGHYWCIFEIHPISVQWGLKLDSKLAKTWLFDYFHLLLGVFINLVVCARALSFYKVSFWCWAKCGTVWGWRTWSIRQSHTIASIIASTCTKILKDNWCQFF